MYSKHLFANKKSMGEERMSLMKILFLLLLPFKFLLCIKLLLLCGLQYCVELINWYFNDRLLYLYHARIKPLFSYWIALAVVLHLST